MYPVEIRDLPEMTLHGLLHVGPYNGIAPVFERLGLSLTGHGLMDRIQLWAGVFHDDAQTTPAEDLRSHACCALPAGTEPPPGLEVVHIPASRAAVLSFRGDYAGLADAWAWFKLQGLADVPLAAGPTLEIYRSMAPAVPVEEQLTELVVPVA